ncbi:hypothetical protein GCM10022226_27480 [Sphaerisporangium flaviroseum]|uniref:Uncharacterized protein n=1 Tax=Sphaerisporangium flaviroseum TaxID=509199 RepID=A0ABP7HXB4_9ACTN
MLHEGRLGAQMSVDKRAAVMLAMAWGLAARSPHSLIYLPLRAARPADSVNEGQPLDLVLLHHRLAFPISRWKQVRARLGAGRPHRVTIPPWAFHRRPVADHRRWSYQGFHDHLRWDIAADTLFLIGSREAFELEADPVRALGEDRPAHLAKSPDAHCCAEINLGRMRMGYSDGRRPWATRSATADGWGPVRPERCLSEGSLMWVSRSSVRRSWRRRLWAPRACRGRCRRCGRRGP